MLALARVLDAHGTAGHRLRPAARRRRPRRRPCCGRSSPSPARAGSALSRRRRRACARSPGAFRTPTGCASGSSSRHRRRASRWRRTCRWRRACGRGGSRSPRPSSPPTSPPLRGVLRVFDLARAGLAFSSQSCMPSVPGRAFSTSHLAASNNAFAAAMACSSRSAITPTNEPLRTTFTTPGIFSAALASSEASLALVGGRADDLSVEHALGPHLVDEDLAAGHLRRDVDARHGLADVAMFAGGFRLHLAGRLALERLADGQIPVGDRAAAGGRDRRRPSRSCRRPACRAFRLRDRA